MNKIPIFVEIKGWVASELELMGYLVRQFEICQFPEAQRFIEQILLEGDGLVLFDGLDEVSEVDEQRRKIIHQILEFSRQYKASQTLITCRIAATDFTFEGFMYVEMADFTPAQIRQFAEKWFANNAFKRKKFLKDIEKKENEGVHELTRSPLLLALLCLAFEETLQISQRRVEIYEEGINALLVKWDASKKIDRGDLYRKLQLGRKRQLFYQVAAETFETGHFVFSQQELTAQIEASMERLPKGEQPAKIDGAAVLKAIEVQHGLFVQRAQQIYSFSHKTFHEYFTAQFIAGLSSEERLRDVVQGHLTDDNWREVFLMTASLMTAADDLFKVCLESIEEMFAADDEGLDNLLEWANKKADEAGRSEQTSAVRSVYFFLSLALALDHALIRDPDLDRAIVPGQGRVRDPDLDRLHSLDLDDIRDLVLNRARALIRILDHDHNRIHTLDYNLTLDLLRDLTINRVSDGGGDLIPTLDHVRNLDWNDEVMLDIGLTLYLQIMSRMAFRLPSERAGGRQVYVYTEFLGRLVTASQNLGLTTLKVALTGFVIPGKAAKEGWKRFAEEVQTVLQRERNIGYKWALDTEQIRLLNDYLSANRLLVDCLEQASVADRAAIENRLLRVPSRRVNQASEEA